MVTILIKGKYSNGKTSAQTEASLSYDDNGRISVSGVDRAPVTATDIKISSRLGNTPRYIHFVDHSQFETEDNDAVDRMMLELGLAKSSLSIHRLESTKRIVAITVVLVFVFGWLSVQYGIPALSKQIAFALPTVVSEKLGENVFEFMDENWFEPTTLPENKRAELQVLFTGLVEKIDNPPALKLIFRDAGVLGANAIALPDGTIVMTDDLVKLEASDMELGSVMLHEIGHVQQRHSLRLATQNFGLAVLIMLFTSDVSTSSSLITAIPVVLVKSGYSQVMEQEADSYALDYMLANNIDPIYFANMMVKLQASYARRLSCPKSGKPSQARDEKCDEQKAAKQGTGKLDSPEETTEESEIVDYFSSHPATKERIERFKSASKNLSDKGKLDNRQ